MKVWLTAVNDYTYLPPIGLSILKNLITWRKISGIIRVP